MSKIAFSAPVDGTGVATIQGPELSSDKTYALPAEGGTLATIDQFNAPGSAPVFACRAWVNFDGTRDSTGAVSTANTPRLIRGSGNVSSVLRNGTGDYTVNFATAMPDANYAAVATGGEGIWGAVIHTGTNNNSYKLTTSARFLVSVNSGTSRVDTEASFAFFR